MALLKIIDANSVPGVSAALGGAANRVVGASLNGIPELQRMGIVGNHTIDSPTNGYMGVPHIDDYSIGEGKERRQMFSFARTTLNGRNHLRFPVTWNINKAQGFRYTFGFNMRLVQQGGFTGAIVAASNTYYLCPFYSNAYPHLFFGISANREFFLGGRATGYILPLNKDTYVEVQLSYDPEVDIVNPDDPASGYNLRHIVRVDGNEISNATTTKTAAYTIDGYATFGLLTNGTTSTSNILCMLFSDLYVTDGTGDAPYNSFLGPVKALPFYPKSAEETEWTASEGETPISALSPPNHFVDTAYVTSPDDNVEAKLRLKMDMPVSDRSIVMGMNVYSRGNRDTGADRSLQGRVFNENGTLVHEGRPQPVQTAISNNLLYSVLPSSVADTASLAPARLGEYVFEFEAPLTT